MGFLSKLFGPPGQDRFARQVIRAFREAGDQREFQYDAEQFRLLVPEADDPENGNEAAGEVLNLHNFYAEHCKLNRAQRREHLKQVVRGVSQGRIELPEEFEHAAPDLRPRIWPRAMFARLELQQRIEGGNEVDIPRYPIGEHLAIGLVYDLPHSMRSISGDDLADWDVTWYQAMEAARDSLAETEFTIANVGEHLYASASGDNYDASRLILTDLIAQIEVQGHHVAIIPNRDTLLVTGSDDEVGLAMMAELAEKALEDPRPLGATPLILRDDEWEDWMPPAGHPSLESFEELRRRYFYLEYADQKESLDRLQQQEQQDVFVASCTAVRNQETGEIFTYCVWPEGIQTLLPESDRIILGAEGQPGQMAAWSQVSAVAGNLMEPVDDLYPPRYSVRSFPTPEQLTEIGGEILSE